MSELPLCAVSIDVDPLPCYYRIHGLGPAPQELRDVVARRALPRFAELFAEYGVCATFFVVAEDLDVQATSGSARATRALYSDLSSAGHELGNHSYSHPYDLARWPAERVRQEIERAHDLIGEVGGHVRGFRAPGYDLSPAMLGELERLEYTYDSSLFPAPAYYGAKALVMAALKASGRPSGAVMTNPRALLAPADCYRPASDAPWRRGESSILEVPIAVTPVLRAPAIGTSLLLAPPWLRRQLISQMARRGVFNFELHGIDLIDAEDDGIPGQLIARQPDLRLPVAHKRAALASMLDQVQQRFEVMRLDELADSAAASLGS